MHRRHLILCGAASLLLPTETQAGYQATPYEWGMRRALNASGETFIFNFRSSWSLTCQIKEELLAELKTETPKYRELTFIDVDFDTYGPSQWVEQLKVRRRSTLVAMKSGAEIDRVENEPRKERLRHLLDTALDA